MFDSCDLALDLDSDDHQDVTLHLHGTIKTRRHATGEK